MSGQTYEQARVTGRVLVVVLVDVVSLFVLVPDWSSIRVCLTHPARWIVRSGIDNAAAQLAEFGLWLVALWIAAALSALTLSGLPGLGGQLCVQLTRLVVPRWSHRYLTVLTGLTIAFAPLEISMASASLAPPITAAQTAAAISGTTTTTNPLDAPAWPVDNPIASDLTQSAEVVVKPGDSLWLIAARYLSQPEPSVASPAEEVLTECGRLYQANADIIGPSPDLIRPGQRLHLPTLQHVVHTQEPSEDQPRQP